MNNTIYDQDIFNLAIQYNALEKLFSLYNEKKEDRCPLCRADYLINHLFIFSKDCICPHFWFDNKHCSRKGISLSVLLYENDQQKINKRKVEILKWQRQIKDELKTR